MRTLLLLSAVAILAALGSVSVGSAGVFDNVPADFRYFCADAQGANRVLTRLEWPAPDYLTAHAPGDAPGLDVCLEDSVFWVRLVFAPECIPADLRQRLVALARDDGRDSVRCQWVVEGYAVHVVQSASGIDVGLRKVGASRVLEQAAQIDLVCDGVGRLLREGPAISEAIRRDATEVGLKETAYGLKGWAYGPRQAEYPTLAWWSLAFVWQTDGQGVALSAPKWLGTPRLRTAVPDWFTVARPRPAPEDVPGRTAQDIWAEFCPYPDIPPYWGWYQAE